MKFIPAFTFMAASAASVAAQQTLQGLAAAKGKYFGTSVDNSEVSDPKLAALAGVDFNVLTPGNPMKWEVTEPTQNSFTYTLADQLVSFATTRNMKVRGHTLVWHSQLPKWVSEGTWTRDTLTAVIENHIDKVMTKYKGQLFHWDVVNEIFNEDGTWRPSVFYKTLGEDFVAIAFRKARAVDPSVKLYINDYNTDAINSKSTALYNLVKKLLAAGVPIDGVGFQSHMIVGQVPSDFQANFERFAALGVEVAITELDIRTTTPASSAALTQQQTDYKNAVLACVNVPKCVGVTVWGFTDKHSWIPSTFPGEGAALPYSDCYKPKPAYNGILSALGGTAVAIESCPTANTGNLPKGAVAIHSGTGGVASGWGDWSYETSNDFYSTAGPSPLIGSTNIKSTTTANNYGIISFKGSTTNFQGMADFVVYAAADFPFSLGLSATSENYYNSPTRPSSSICESTPSADKFVKCTLNIPELETEAGKHAWDRIMIWTNKAGPNTAYFSTIYLAPAGAAVETIAPPANSAVIFAGNGLASGWGDWSWACTNNAYFAGPPKPLIGDYVFQGTSNSGNYGGISFKGTTAAFQAPYKKIVFYAAADPKSTAAPNWSFRFEATSESYYASAEYPFSKICAGTLSSTSYTRCELSLDEFIAANGVHAWDRIDFMSKINTGQTLYLGYVWAEPAVASSTCSSVQPVTTTSTKVVTVTAPGETVTQTETTTAPAVTIVAPAATVTTTTTAAAVTVTNTATQTVTTVTTATPGPCPKQRKVCNGKYIDISCCENGTMCVKSILNDFTKSEFWNCVSYGGGLLDIFDRR